MAKKLKPPKKSQKRVQVVTVTGTPPANMQTVVGIVLGDGDPSIPDNLQSVASATYSLGSPPIPGVLRIAALSFSLGSVGIPANFKRIIILPET